MPTSKVIKKICMEAFQLAAFSTPILVTGQRFATKECSRENNTTECIGTSESRNTTYWLIISGIIAYIAGIILLVWLPIKLFVTWKKIVRPYEGLWFPGNVLYIVFSFVPCVAFVLRGKIHCMEYCFDYFNGAPIETMVIMMVVTDWSEKIRYIKLRSADDSIRTKKYPYSDFNENKRSRQLDYSTSLPENPIQTVSRRSSISQRSLLHASGIRRGTLRQRFAASLSWTDARPENLLRDLMLAYDTRLVMGLSLLKDGEENAIFKSGWTYPIYILSAISLIPLVFSPNSKMRSSTTVILQDVPFFILRVAIFSKYGAKLVLQTSMLFLLKNFFVAFAFFYFNVILPWRQAKKENQQYELEQFDDGVVNSTVAQEFATGSRPQATGNAYESQYVANGYAAQFGGYSNPSYQSKRYESTRNEEFRRQHSPRNQHDEYQWNERDDYGEDPEDDELYPSRRQMQYEQSHVARVERQASLEYTTNNSPPVSPSAVTQHPPVERDLVENYPQQNSTQNKPREINYHTLNDPNSFLYNRDRRSERRSVRPKAHDINFDRGNAQAPVSTALSQTKPNTSHVIPPSTGGVATSSPPPRLTHTESENADTGVGTSDPVNAQKTEESTYAQINSTKKKSRRMAPPPPTSVSSKTPNNLEDLPPPPPEVLNDDQDGAHGEDFQSRQNSQKPIGRQESLYTPNIARQLAGEAANIRRSDSQKQQKEAMDALEEATEYGRQMINSRSTTPKSTYSAAQAANVNDEEYDDRL